MQPYGPPSGPRGRTEVSQDSNLKDQTEPCEDKLSCLPSLLVYSLERLMHPAALRLGSGLALLIYSF